MCAGDGLVGRKIKDSDESDRVSASLFEIFNSMFPQQRKVLAESEFPTGYGTFGEQLNVLASEARSYCCMPSLPDVIALLNEQDSGDLENHRGQPSVLL